LLAALVMRGLVALGFDGDVRLNCSRLGLIYNDGATRLYSLATSLFSENSEKLYAAAVGFLLSGIFWVTTPSKKISMFDALGVFVIRCLFLYTAGHYSGMAPMKQMVILY